MESVRSMDSMTFFIPPVHGITKKIFTSPRHVPQWCLPLPAIQLSSLSRSQSDCCMRSVARLCAFCLNVSFIHVIHGGNKDKSKKNKHAWAGFLLQLVTASFLPPSRPFDEATLQLLFFSMNVFSLIEKRFWTIVRYFEWRMMLLTHTHLTKYFPSPCLDSEHNNKPNCHIAESQFLLLDRSTHFTSASEKRRRGRTWWESRSGGRIKKSKQTSGVERRSRVRRARRRRRSKGSRRRMLYFHWHLKSSRTAVSRLRTDCLSVFRGASMEQRVHSTSSWENNILVYCGRAVTG